MDIFLKQIGEIAESIKKAKKGSIYFLALIKLLDPENTKWDFVICGDWIKQNGKVEDIELVLRIIREHMNNDASSFSQIVTLTPESGFSQNFVKTLKRENLQQGMTLYNLNIANGLILPCVQIIELNTEEFNLLKEEKKSEEKPALGDVDF